MSTNESDDDFEAFLEDELQNLCEEQINGRGMVWYLDINFF